MVEIWNKNCKLPWMKIESGNISKAQGKEKETSRLGVKLVGPKFGEKFGYWESCPYMSLSFYLVEVEYGFNIDVLEVAKGVSQRCVRWYKIFCFKEKLP
eukprot:563971-Ditylum_brightwellii.AAC.1